MHHATPHSEGTTARPISHRLFHGSSSSARRMKSHSSADSNGPATHAMTQSRGRMSRVSTRMRSPLDPQPGPTAGALREGEGGDGDVSAHGHLRLPRPGSASALSGVAKQVGRLDSTDRMYNGRASLAYGPSMTERRGAVTQVLDREVKSPRLPGRLSWQRAVAVRDTHRRSVSSPRDDAGAQNRGRGGAGVARTSDLSEPRSTLPVATGTATSATSAAKTGRVLRGMH